MTEWAGILLAGGVDMDPCTFGEPPHPNLGRIDRDRDTVELQLARWALEDRKPILGLCRGHQVLNVALGGTLWQDIEAQVPEAIKHDYFPTAGYARDFPAHEVALAPGSRLARAFGGTSIRVNSMHHQGGEAARRSVGRRRSLPPTASSKPSNRAPIVARRGPVAPRRCSSGPTREPGGCSRSSSLPPPGNPSGFHGR